MEAAKLDRDCDYAEYLRQPPDKRGLKKVKPWDEGLWRRTTKKKPVRSKPYEIPEAAKLCADMAAKSGWLDVEINEIKRECA
ncbi:MAG: hypothetical protein H0X13_19865 [Ramlibacter sp.]|nr:hypothetical protein [Ramlibacter sp.]